MSAAARSDAARWARAFPRRWREQHLDGLLDTVEELASDADRLDRRAALDLVLAGWGERLRSHPPLGAWLGYSLFERRLAPTWHPWVLDDVRGRLFWLRSWFRRAGMLWIVYLGIWMAFRLAGSGQGFPWLLLAGPALALPLAPATVRRQRRRVLHRQGLDEHGSWVAPAAWGAPWIPPVEASHPVAGAAALLGGTCILVGAALAWGAAFPRATTAGPFGTIHTDGAAPIPATAVLGLAVAGVVLGAVTAPLVARAARRRSPDPDRPALSARQQGTRRLAGASVLAAGGAYSWAGVVSVFPDAASAGVAFGLLTAGLLLVGLAWGARRGATDDRPLTYADLLTSRSRYTVPSSAPSTTS